MTMTRKERAEYARRAYKYMIEEFMEVKLGGPIDKALDYAGMEGDIRRVVKLSDTQIEQLQYKTGEGIDQKINDLPVGSKQLVRIVVAFYIYAKNQGVDIDMT